jgi:hypothetical protein
MKGLVYVVIKDGNVLEVMRKQRRAIGMVEGMGYKKVSENSYQKGISIIKIVEHEIK